MEKISEATVWVACDGDGDFAIGPGKRKLVRGGFIWPTWNQHGPGTITLCSKQMRKAFPVLRSMRPGATPRRLKITMEFEEE